jgi:pimeloyl-ACP methyl ester carboxylesterase
MKFMNMNTLIIHPPADASRPGPGEPRRAVVFVHGIFSSHRTLDKMRLSLMKSQQFEGWVLASFEYDYFQNMMDSASILAIELNRHFQGSDQVALVCHSMGGLVGRLAILGGTVPFVGKLVMLGTPNFGAVRTAAMSHLAQAAMMTSRLLFGLFTRKTGVLDLTRVTVIFKEPIAKGLQHAKPVAYVTIPGLFFNEDRAFFDTGDWGEWKRRLNLFTPLYLGIDVLNSYLPLWKIGMTAPHDGIVEASSNCLISTAQGAKSEKSPQINHHEYFKEKSYAHIIHDDCSDLTHTQIHHNQNIIDTVRSILLSDDLDQWSQSLSATPALDALDVRYHR